MPEAREVSSRTARSVCHGSAYLLLLVGAVQAIASWQGVGSVGALAIEAACAVLIAQLWRVGALSLAGVAVFASLGAFLCKWIVRSSPIDHSIPYDNDRAIVIYAIFLCSFAATWTLLRGIGVGREVGSPQTIWRLPPVTAGWMVAFIGVSSFIRYWLANAYGIGVPGVVPSAPTGFGPLFGGLYYLSVYGPVVAVLVVLGTARPGERARIYGTCLSLVLYVSIGATIGSRSSAVFAGASVLLGVSWSRGTARNVSSFLIWLIIAVTGAFAGVSAALATRESTFSRDGSALDFLLGRIGGLDYLAPVAAAVDGDRPSLQFIDPVAWNTFLKVAVYHLPAGATNGLASTLPGWALGVAGYLGVMAAGATAGFIAGAADRSQILRAGRIGARVSWAGLLLAWAVLLLEGGLTSAVYVAIIFASMGRVSSWLVVAGPAQHGEAGVTLPQGERQLNRARRHERRPQPDSSRSQV